MGPEGEGETQSERCVLWEGEAQAQERGWEGKMLIVFSSTDANV
jgi:hypothetical protein